MKVLHIISGGDTGGAKTHVLSLVSELNKHVDVKLVCFIEDEFYREGKELGIDIQLLMQKKRYDISIIKKLKYMIESKGYDIIHCHGARANFIGMLLKVSINKPFITTMHSDYKLDFKDNFYKRLVFTSINALSLRFFDYYIAISSNFKQMLIERGFNDDKIFTVYNGIDFNKEINIESKKSFLKEHNIDAKDMQIVGIMARLDEVKNHEVFINAAQKVLKERKDVLFLIAGEGPEHDKLMSMTKNAKIDSHVIFLGYVKKPYSFFNVIDINVLTSNSESFPYVILEGARLKKPIISTDVGGIGDLIENGVNGYLFEVGNSDALAKYLKELLCNKQRTKDMGKNLYKKVNDKFSLKRMGSDHFDIYKKIMK